MLHRARHSRAGSWLSTSPRRCVVGLLALALATGCGGGDRTGGGRPDSAAPDSAAVVAQPAAGGAQGGVEGGAAGAPAARAENLTPLGAGAAAAALDLPDGSCPLYGQWQLCSVADRLERSGFVLRPVEGLVGQPGLELQGSAYLLGRAEIQLYLYADSAGAADAERAVDVGKARPAEATGILRPPAAIRSNNLLALVFNNNDRQLERVQLALAGGLPTH